MKKTITLLRVKEGRKEGPQVVGAVEAHQDTSGTSRDMQVSRRQVGHKWRQVGDKCITLYTQAAQSTQTVVGEHARNASPETEAK